LSICTTAHASTRDIRTHDGLNVAWAAVAAINASRASINTALTLIWHLEKIESKRGAHAGTDGDPTGSEPDLYYLGGFPQPSLAPAS